MDRELLLEIGCEEIPASWLPGLTVEIGDVLVAQLREHRLPPESPAETFSTPRRLTVRVVRLAERQSDLEALVNGPGVVVADIGQQASECRRDARPDYVGRDSGN